MVLLRRVGCGLGTLIVGCALGGCRAPCPHLAGMSETLVARPSPGAPADQPHVADSPAVRPAAYRQPAVDEPAAGTDTVVNLPGELSLDQLIADVQARNPSLQSMVYAWRAAAQRYPQVVRLDDPMFMAMMAPRSFGSNQVNAGYTLQGAQKLPWFGKLQTRGQGAQAEAGAAFQDVQDARLAIDLVTRLAFYDYYLAVRLSEINQQNTQVAQEFRDSAAVRYENNLVTQQDVIQADVELADLQRRKIELERMRSVAIARINTLLLRAPNDSLPPPPDSLPPEPRLPAVDSVHQMAMAQRPDLAAIAARVRAEQAAVELARLQYYPDVEFFGRYDAFWQESDLQAAAGMNLNVPIYRRRLNAAVSEAQFRLSQRQAEYRQRIVDIQYEVQSGYEQVDEARRTVELYDNRFVPLAEQNLRLARADYDVGRNTYLNLVMAQRQLFAVRERHEQALADYYRRLADLERAVGGPLRRPAEIEEIPEPKPLQ